MKTNQSLETLKFCKDILHYKGKGYNIKEIRSINMEKLSKYPPPEPPPAEWTPPGVTCLDCPLIYGIKNNQKIYLGEILRNYNCIEKSEFQSLYINDVYDNIIVSEEKQEVSYINIIYMDYIDNNGNLYREFPLNNTNFTLYNDNYYELKNGESINLYFNIPNNKIVKSILMMRGYYIINEKIIE